MPGYLKRLVHLLALTLAATNVVVKMGYFTQPVSFVVDLNLLPARRVERAA
jgi:hypothetical protein